MQTALRCPMCGTMNPVGNVNCERCQARLIPLAAPQHGEPERGQGPIREPSPPVGPPEEMGAQTVDERTPGAEPDEPAAGDWLAQLRASAAQETVEPDVIEEPIEPAEIPDWLRDMGPVSLETRTEPEKRRAPAEPGLEEQSPAGPPPTVDQFTERPQALEPAEVPDWLHEIAPPEAAAPKVAPPAAKLAPEEAAPPIPPPVEAEIPDWLREIAPPEAAAPEAPPPVAGPEPEAATPPVLPPVEAEVPDWLRELAPPEIAAPKAPPPVAGPEPETAAPPVLPPVEAEVPDWLRELAPPEIAAPEAPPPVAGPEPEEAAPSVLPPVEAEVPDWLREIAPPEMAAPEAPLPAAELAPEEAAPSVLPPIEAEVPDWLHEIAPPEAATPEAPPSIAEPEPEAAAPSVLPPVEAEAPDWLRELAPPETAAPEAPPPVAGPEPETTAPPVLPPVEAEVPDWLRDIAPPEMAPPPSPAIGMPERLAEAPAEAAPAVPPLTEPPAEGGGTEVPEWLTELKAEPSPPPAPSAPAFAGIAPSAPSEAETGIAAPGGLAPAAIPDWLEALRPRPEAALAIIEEEPAEMEGLLEGLRGVLSPAPAFGAPAVEQAPPSTASEVSLARAQLLQSLLAQPAKAPQPQTRKRGAGTGERFQRWLVTVVLFIATWSVLIAPLLGIDLPTLTQSTTPSAVIRSYNAVQGLSAGDPVLVAFEYGPSEADELNLVGEPVLRHLVERGAQMSIVSTRPENQAVAEGLLSAIAAPLDQYTYSYRPGDATGVSQLLTDALVQPRMILVLTARPGPLRWWVEQTQARYGDTIPVVIGMSAALESAASPYQDTRAGQVEGAIYGLSGAAGYETLLGSPEQITGQLNALALGHLAIVGLMILGALFYTLGGLQGRKK